MRSKADSVFLIIGTVLILAALSLFLYNRRENAVVEKATAEVSLQLEEQIEEARRQKELEKSGNTGESENGEEGDASSPASTPAPAETVDTSMTVTTIQNHDYIGRLSIPGQGLDLPIMNDWDYVNLQIAPCRYAGSTKSHDLVICAHNFDCHFGVLKDMSVGDDVIFTDMDGKTWYYTVAAVETLDPGAIDEMISGEYDLTLFTCTYGGATRVTVRCEQVGESLPE